MTSSPFLVFRWILCISLLGCPIAANADEASLPPTFTTAQLESVRLIRIGKSSVWVPRYEYDKLIDDGILPYGGGLGVKLIGPITQDDVPVFQKLLAPYLDKNYFIKNPKPYWYKSDPTNEGYRIYLDSEGGDVYAAMAIGRMFRKARVLATVGSASKCVSACVFLLTGAVNRFIMDGAVIGIHRPYSAETKAVSFEELQTKTTRLGIDVAAYLSEMNISNSLYESMKRIPSENIRILNQSEIEGFGLDGKDPVFAELNDNAEAKLAGVSKSEYLKRKALSRKCLLEEYQRFKPSNNGSLDDVFATTKIKNDCDLKIIYKDVVDENGKWRGNPSQQYCMKLIDETTEAMYAKDWRRILEAQANRERNCAKDMTVNELAETIDSQAMANFELGNFREALSESNR